jgi:hypothetical protein
VKDYCWQASLTDPLPRHYDLVTCIEVIEHIPPDDAEVSVANLCASADRILLSSTPHDYSEPTHVNVHPPEDWAAQLARHGFLRNLDVDVTFLTEWAMLFERRPGGLPEAARQYERLLFRLQREVRELRDTTLSMQSRLEHELGDEGEEDRLREELIGTRDALIGAEASLGEALGQVRALDVELSRYKDAADRLDEVMRSSVWRFYLPYQKARSRYGARLRAVLSRLR